MGSALKYLDSSVALDVIDPQAVRHARVESAILSIPLSEFAVSDLVRLECLVQAIRSNDPIRLADLRAFFGSVVTLTLEPAVFDRAAQLRAGRPSLKTPDALHLATALHHNCDEFWTNDRDLAKVSVGLSFQSF